MTDLAHACVMLSIPFDSHRLYRMDDPMYELWLSVLIERVDVSNRAK